MRIQKKWSSYSLASRKVIPTKSDRPTESICKGSRNIAKFQKPNENIQNLNDDRYAYQDLGYRPIDLHVDNPDNGDQVGKCEDFFPSLCKYTHTTRTYVKCYYLFYSVFCF